MGTGDILLGVTLRWTSIPSRGEKQYSQLLHATETGISSGRVGLLGSCATLRFYLMVNLHLRSSLFSPLLYSLHIQEDFKTLRKYAFNSKDYAVTPGSPWNYAIKLNNEDFVVVENGITKGVPPFSNDGAPVLIRAKVCWGPVRLCTGTCSWSLRAAEPFPPRRKWVSTASRSRM